MPVNKKCVCISKFTDFSDPPGDWLSIIHQAEIPETITGFRWDFNLYNATWITGAYTGELVNWMFYIRRPDINDGTGLTPPFEFPDSNDGELVFNGPQSDLISTGWIICDQTIMNNDNQYLGPWDLNLGGGGGELVDGSGIIEPITGQITDTDAVAEGWTFPSGGGKTVAKQTGKTNTQRKLQTGDQLVFSAHFWNCLPTIHSNANLIGSIQFITMRP